MDLTAKKKMEIISALPLFDGLAEEYLGEIADLAVEKRFKRGELIFSDGDPCNGFYIVIDGTIKVFKISPEGKEQIFHILGHGEPFGEVPVFTGKPFPANAEAITNSRLLFFPKDQFYRLISDTPSLSLNMLGILSARLRQFALQIEHLSLKEVPSRLASYLIYLAEEQGRPDVVTLSISKGQLASLLGTMPETLSRIFARMTRGNLIYVNSREIELKDMEGLHALADGVESLV